MKPQASARSSVPPLRTRPIISGTGLRNRKMPTPTIVPSTGTLSLRRTCSTNAGNRRAASIASASFKTNSTVPL